MNQKQTESKPQDVEEPREEGLDETTCYRLLNFDDEMEGSDEFLEDDAVTWTRLDIQHRWNVGGWWHANLKPMRRKISSDNAIAQTPTTGASTDTHINHQTT